MVRVSAAQAPVYDSAITRLEERDEKSRRLAKLEARREAMVQLGVNCLHEIARQTLCLERARKRVMSEQLAENEPGS